jgi:hypothetical protein
MAHNVVTILAAIRGIIACGCDRKSTPQAEDSRLAMSPPHTPTQNHLLDRPQLEAQVCECYAVVKKEYARLLGGADSG